MRRPATQEPAPRLDERAERVFHPGGEGGEPAGGEGAVDSAVVDRQVQRITVATASAPPATTGCCLAAPTARIPDCGGLMIAENSTVPYMPRFETAKVPPSSSCCSSFLSLARCARAADSRAIADSFLPSTPRSTGVTSPVPVATAIDMSTDRYASSPSSVQVTFASGTSPNAAATAAITKSLTDTFTGDASLTRLRSARSSSTVHSAVR